MGRANRRQGTRRMIAFGLGTSGQRLTFSDAVISHLEQWRQLRFWQAEAGGLLFARLSAEEVLVELATGPRRTDRRSRWSYLPDRAAEQREIDEMHPQGLYFVGTWHSHPESIPRPSGVDLHSLAESFRLSTHHLNAFVLAIIGQHPTPEGLAVMVADGAAVISLKPIDAASVAEMDHV